MTDANFVLTGGGGIVEIIPPTEDVPRHPVSKAAN